MRKVVLVGSLALAAMLFAGGTSTSSSACHLGYGYTTSSYGYAAPRYGYSYYPGAYRRAYYGGTWGWRGRGYRAWGWSGRRWGGRRW